jgi:TonB family protein
LVESIREPLKHANARKVIVFDLRGSNDQVHPVGRWLADQVALTMRNNFPEIAVVDRSLLNPIVVPASNPPAHLAIFEAEVRQARSLGADTMITGSFAKAADQLGVSLSVATLSHLEKTQEVRAGPLPISEAILNLATEPLPGLELHDGIPQAGTGGISAPVCTNCPSPDYPRNGRGGVVQLEVVVRPDGRTDKIKIIESPDPDLANNTVRAVRKWRFKPAIGFDGVAIAAFAQVQVTFQQR